MKFSKYLESQSVPEWRKAYIYYKGLKKKLKQVERFRKSKERRAAAYIDQYFQNIDQTPSHKLGSGICNSPSFIYYFDRSTSRPASIKTSRTSISILDEVLYHASSSERQFFDSLDYELDKISRFYNEKEQEAKLKLDVLKVQVQFIAEFGRQLLDLGPTQLLSRQVEDGRSHGFKYQDQSYTLFPNGEQRISYTVARNRLKKAITEYYRSLEFLKSYRELNETGFQKILKKFDKIAGWKASTLYMKVVRKQHWITSTELNRIINETETLYINEFADGHRRRGMSKLRAPETNKEYTSTTLRVGILLGMAITLFIQAIQIAADPSIWIQLPNIYINMQIYACFLLPVLFCLGFSVNLVIWHRARINYKFIFELNPRQNLDYHQFAELPSFLLFISAFIIYSDFSQLAYPTVPSELYPLILFIAYMVIMLCPFNMFYLSARRWLGTTLVRIVLSYFFAVEFRDFFIADELNSLAYSIWTSSYFFCAYSEHWSNLEETCNVPQYWISPILASLPPWWRLLQCFRRYKDSNEKVHLLNAAKYTSSILAALVSGARRIYPSRGMDILWVCVCIVNSCYTTIWDIKMDWGLFMPNSKHFLLRDELVFSRWTYYVAISINILLRFSWTISTWGLPLSSQLLAFLIALLEGYRRIQWNVFRLENEHLNNCGQYRAIKEIPLPFALCETNVDQDPLERVSLKSAEPIPIARHPSYHTIRQSYDVGSFYGRRDFENKRDEDVPVGSVNSLCRKPSTLEHVLTHIRSLRGSLQGSDNSDDDEDEDDSEDGRDGERDL